ncbi:GNAT family N-acetyltransferase [Kocuria sp. M1R5S2]|uniref:GNAT family N-acetyltransferase n=1 Tax=Kocuria rhizosphaerae TaxID=3376285 RepID=UPI0037A6D59B
MVRVRTAGPSELAAAGRLLDAFNREFGDPTPGAEWLSRRLAELVGRGGTIVLLAGEGPDAIAVVRVRPGLWSAGDEWYLAELYVVPGRRGHGVGRALLSAVLERARAAGADLVDVATSEDDVAARALYESVGFTRFEGGDGGLTFSYELEL